MDDVGTVVRELRRARKLSVRMLASRAAVSHSQLVNIEAGRRSLSPEIARSLDAALDTRILSLLAAEGDPVKRRKLVTQLGTFLAVGAATGPSALSEVIRLGLVNGGGGEDWHAAIDSYGRRLVRSPDALLGASLLADLQTLHRDINEGRPSLDTFRNAAQLAQLYGLWLGNKGELGGAARWYESAVSLADRSRDIDTQTWTRGRSAARGIYETWTVRQTVDSVAQIQALTPRATAGAMEGFAALISLCALVGEARQGRQAVASMRQVVERLPDQTLSTMAGPAARTEFLAAFLECKVGSLEQAERACAEAAWPMADWPLWRAELEVYLARARVAHGDVRGGLAHALDVVTGLEHNIRVIAVAVRDVLTAVPPEHRSEEHHALSGYAYIGPTPWETLR